MLSSTLILFLSLASVQAAVLPRQTPSNNTVLPVHNITRIPGIKFENLAIRPNGQILTTTTLPNASIYQVDPLGILPTTVVYTIPDIRSATGIAEGKHDLYYVASSGTNPLQPNVTYPESYFITEMDMHGVSIFPNSTLSKDPRTKIVARLPDAGLPNGIAFARPGSDHLLVADSIRGLIWNVNVCNGQVDVTLDDATTKGVPGAKNSSATGINGLKVHDSVAYWTVTGTSRMFKVPINEDGTVVPGETPKLVTDNLSCDDLALDHEGNAYVAGPANVITRVGTEGAKTVIAGAYNATNNLIGPSSVAFGKLTSDRWSLYVTTNAGFSQVPSDATGVSRIDLGNVV